MKRVFADTSFWVAKINRADELHARADEAEAETGSARLTTTEAILIEVLNYFSGFRFSTKHAASISVRRIWAGEEIEVIAHTQSLFRNGQDLYEARLDKGYSLTDCISMNLMRERRITDILTHDRHFAQEGFTVLL